MKKIFILAVMLTVASSGFARVKNIVKVTTSCGKIAYIDTGRTTVENTIRQVIDIDEVLCGD